MYTSNSGGAHFLTGFGRSLGLLEREIMFLLNGLTEKHVILNSILEKIDIISNKIDFISNKNHEEKQEEEKIKIDVWDKQIETINLTIEKINSLFLRVLNIKKEIIKLNKNRILELIQKRFEKSSSNEESIFLANDNLRMALIIEINKTLNSIEQIHDYLNDKECFEGFEKLSKDYKKDVLEAIHIYSIGYGKRAVLCIGVTIEGLINKYLLKLFEKGRILKEDYENKIDLKYIQKIGFLNGKFLTDEEFTGLKYFSFKRNKGGHPNLGEISNDEARNLIQQGILQIIHLQEKINQVKSEEDKAREMLGGKSLHSSFLNDKSEEIDDNPFRPI